MYRDTIAPSEHLLELEELQLMQPFWVLFSNDIFFCLYWAAILS